MSGAANKLLLPLPAAGATVASGGGEDAASWARRSASAGGSSQVSAYGGSSWKQVVDSQQQQGTKVLPKAKAAAKVGAQDTRLESAELEKGIAYRSSINSTSTPLAESLSVLLC